LKCFLKFIFRVTPNERQSKFVSYYSDLFKMNQNQNQDNKPQCAAAEFGYCSKDDVKDRTVIFMMRNMKIGPVPDKEVNVSMCDFHYKWLVTKNNGVEPLEMRGKFVDEAIGEDLFNAFEPYDIIRKKSRLFTIWWNPLKNDQIVFFNGDDTKHPPARFERGWEKAGVLHFDEDVDDEDNGFVQFLEPISKTVSEHLKEYQVEGRLGFYILPNDGFHRHPREQLLDVECWCVDIDDISYFFKDRMYLPNAICNYLNGFHFELSQKEKQGRYRECIEFILTEVSKDIMKMPGLRDRDNYDYDHGFDNENAELESREKEKLIGAVEQMMNLLETKNVSGMYALWDSTVTDHIDFASVLWVVYTYTNHHLYTEYEDLGKYNDQLVAFFVDEGLGKELLTIAISGERERYVDIHMKAWYNILYPSVNVVKALVPAYISTNEVIHIDKKFAYLEEDKVEEVETTPLTAIQYWHHYDNTITNVAGGGIGIYAGFAEEQFEKDADILEYLESQQRIANE